MEHRKTLVLPSCVHVASYGGRRTRCRRCSIGSSALPKSRRIQSAARATPAPWLGNSGRYVRSPILRKPFAAHHAVPASWPAALPLAQLSHAARAATASLPTVSARRRQTEHRIIAHRDAGGQLAAVAAVAVAALHGCLRPPLRGQHDDGRDKVGVRELRTRDDAAGQNQ